MTVIDNSTAIYYIRVDLMLLHKVILFFSHPSRENTTLPEVSQGQSRWLFSVHFVAAVLLPTFSVCTTDPGRLLWRSRTPPGLCLSSLRRWCQLSWALSLSHSLQEIHKWLKHFSRERNTSHNFPATSLEPWLELATRVWVFSAQPGEIRRETGSCWRWSWIQSQHKLRRLCTVLHIWYLTLRQRKAD